MSSLLVHDMDTAWTSSAPAALQVAVDTQTCVGAGVASNRLVAQAGAVNASAEFVPATPLDLRDYDELRFWVLGNRAAHGTTVRPFYLEFSYTDADDTPDDVHRWFVPINQGGRWEQRRIGIQDDRRSAITQLRWTCLTALPFGCNIDELLAVREEMLTDLEQALTQWLDHQAVFPGVTNVRLNETANPRDTRIVLPSTPGFNAGNRLLLRGGSAGDEIHHVVGVTHNIEAGSTTLDIDPAAAVVGTLTAGVATASVMVPVIVETPPLPTSNPSPAIIVTQLDAREDLERTGYSLQRDSFRQRGAVTVCSVRPGARAYVVAYQILAVAPERVQQQLVHTWLLQRLSMDIGLRIHGVPSPVWIMPPPKLRRRRLGLLAPVYIHIGTRMETAPRQERPWVRQAAVTAGHLDAPLDQEGIVIEL